MNTKSNSNNKSNGRPSHLKDPTKAVKLSVSVSKNCISNMKQYLARNAFDSAIRNQSHLVEEAINKFIENEKRSTQLG